MNDIASDSDQMPLWRHDHRPGPAQPALGLVGVDRRTGRRIRRRLSDRLEGTIVELRDERDVVRAEKDATGGSRLGPGWPAFCAWRRARDGRARHPRCPWHRSRLKRGLRLRARRRWSEGVPEALPPLCSSRSRPSSVSARAILRRSSAECVRSTAPRCTSASTTEVTLGAGHGELLRERARGVGTPRDLDEHPVLGRRQVERPERYLDLSGEAGDRPADRAVVQFGHRIVRVPNHLHLSRGGSPEDAW